MTASLLTNSGRLGPYRILNLLGAGGMGEVYRAHDSRLRRDVAIKVLPTSYATDPDLLKRLEREARAISQLNHPNIVAVYDVGSEAGVEYVVMELLEGETLGAKLKNGPVSPRRALDYATQIARGLAAAHDKGIIHRDLKPENVFITTDGRVKILDFGLAHQLRGENELSRAVSKLTAPGMVVGTVAYMSPEQARGLPIDRRSDVFSFGAVLYEMLSGKLPFEAETVFETMMAIVNGEPRDLKEVVPNLPPVLYRIVHHCLEKAPDARFQSARDLAFDLENCSEIAWGTSTAAPTAVPAALKKERRPTAAIAVAIAVVAMAAAALTTYLITRGRTAEAPTFHRLTFRPALIQSARFTADGKTVAYSASMRGQPLRVHVLRTDRPESQALAIPNGEVAGISRTGEMAVILNNRLYDWSVGGVLAEVPVLGGTPREIVDGVLRADWAPDGRLAVWRRTEKGQQLEFPIGNVLFTSPKIVYGMRVSPKSDRIALNIAAEGHKYDIMVIGLDGSKRTLATADVFARGMAWRPDGEEVWFSVPRNRDQVPSIHGVTLDGQERLIMRTPAWPWLYDVALDGTVLLGLTSTLGGIMVPAGGSGKAHDLAWLDTSTLADVSSDGKAILFTEWNEGVQYKATVYMRSTDESPAVRLGEGIAVALSPDKESALALRPGPNRRELILLPTGAGKTETLRNDLDCLWGGWLPDGRIVINAQTPQGPRMFIQARDGTPPRPITPPGVAIGFINPGGFGAIRPISPDGRSLLVFDREQRAFLVSLASPQAELRPAPGVQPGDQPTGWSRDGQHVYVYQVGPMPVQIHDVDLATGERKLLREIAVPDPEGVYRMNPFLLMPDGENFAYGFFRQVTMLYTANGLR